MIAVKKVKSELTDDDDGDDEDEHDDVKINEENPNIDQIGNVQNNLKQCNVSYFPKDEWGIIDGKTPDGIRRNLMTNYRGLRGLSNSKQPYPQNKRVCVFIDRRDKKPTNGEVDEMTFFEPSDDSNKIDNDCVPEIGFELIRKCLIPRKDNDNIIGSNQLCGQLLTFMFNVQQVDEIKCYIIWNGQTMRFHAEHISTILPTLFINSNENKEFVNGKDSKGLQQLFEKNINDRKFTRFYQALQAYE